MYWFSQNISYLAIVESDRLNLHTMSTKNEESNTQVSIMLQWSKIIVTVKKFIQILIFLCYYLENLKLEKSKLI